MTHTLKVGTGKSYEGKGSLPKEIEYNFQASADMLEKELSATPLAYKVVHSKPITLRSEKSVYAKEIGSLAPGEVIKGFPVGPWLHVKERGAWVLVDGKPIGVSDLLVPEWAQLTFSKVGADLHVEWPGLGIPGVIYYVQWLPKHGIEVRDGATLIAMQHGKQAAAKVIPNIPNQTQTRVIAVLESGLLVGAWSFLDLEIDILPDGSSKPQPENIPADVLGKAVEKYKALSWHLEEKRRAETQNHTEVDIARHLYAERPRDSEKAKQMVMALIFGGAFGEKDLGAAEGQVEDMFAAATAGYEEGLAGECNRILADVVATLVRKHG